MAKRVVPTLLRRLLRIVSGTRRAGPSTGSPEPDVPFQPTPKRAVEQMLSLAGVHAGDVVYDLGCGDGRIPITAARRCGARAVGIDIDPKRIARARRHARGTRAQDRVAFRHEDFFESDISEATVVTLFLWPEVNLELRPKLLRELKPGTRVVSYFWEIGDWLPEKEIAVDGRPVYLWTIPARRPCRVVLPARDRSGASVAAEDVRCAIWA